MKIALITIFLVISPSFTYADEISNKNLGQGVGGFLGILSTQMMQIDNPYALATGGLLGMFIGGQVGENMDNIMTSMFDTITIHHDLCQLVALAMSRTIARLLEIWFLIAVYASRGTNALI